MKKSCSVEHVNRQVIENKLLTALSDEKVVAILATKQDCEDLHAALCGYVLGERDGDTISWRDYHIRCKQLAKDIKQLMDSAFPQEPAKKEEAP